MAKEFQKLELTWIGKDEEPEPKLHNSKLEGYLSLRIHY